MPLRPPRDERHTRAYFTPVNGVLLQVLNCPYVDTKRTSYTTASAEENGPKRGRHEKCHLLHSASSSSGVVLDGPLLRHLGFELSLQLRQHVLAVLELRFRRLQLLLRVLELDLRYSEGFELWLYDLPMDVCQGGRVEIIYHG